MMASDGGLMGEDQMDDEAWRPVPGMEDFYEASNLGRVRSLPRLIVQKNGSQYLKPGRIMRQYSSGKTGYLNLTLNNNLNPVKYYVHRVVLMAFVGQPARGMDGCHEDGNKTNNRLSNLRWDTRSGNLADRVAHGTDNRGERHGMARLSENDVLEMKRLRSEGLIYGDIAKKFDVSMKTAQRIVTGKRWGHLMGKEKK